MELENNKIASLETGTFTGLASLTRVGLGLLPTETYTFDPGSDRQHLAGVRFSSLRGVLEGCRFAVTPNQKVLERCFCTSGQTTLDLSRQGLTGIKPGAFEHCESLTKLILRFNNNTKQGAFDEGAFDWLGNRGDGDVHFVGLGLSFMNKTWGSLSSRVRVQNRRSPKYQAVLVPATNNYMQFFQFFASFSGCFIRVRACWRACTQQECV